MYGTIKLENIETTYEIDDETHTSIELNHYKIVSTSTNECGLLKIIFSSSDDMKFLIVSNVIIDMVTLLHYRFNNADFSELKIRGGSSYIVRAQFINNSRVIVLTANSDTNANARWEKIYIIDETGSIVLKETGITHLTVFTENALYAVDQTKFYNVIINYETGYVSMEETGLELSTGSIYGQEYMFDSTCKYLLYVMDTGYFTENIKIYELSGFEETAEITCLKNIDYDAADNYFIKLRALPDYRTFVNPENGKTVLYNGESDEKKLIGLNYNGQMFYSNIYDPEVLTAKQEDVKKDKTFIGYAGIPETGTMEVT